MFRARSATRERLVGTKLKSRQVKGKTEEMLKDLDVLEKHQVFQDAETIQDIKAAIEELANIPDEEDDRSQNTHHGSGNIVFNTGSGTQTNISSTNTGSGTSYTAERQHFGRDSGTG